MRMLMRLTPQDDALIAAFAADAGATKSEYVRARALQHTPRHNATATGERRALIEALGALGKIGGNLNQIARNLNSGYAPEIQALQFALSDVAFLGTAIRNILLYGDHRQDPTER